MPAEQDVIGPWSEVKLDILRAYAVPYSTILTARNFHRYYIDAFAAGGSHISRKSGVGRLRELGAGRADVHVHLGDCNEILLQHVFPKARYEDHRRALCLLDPYNIDRLQAVGWGPEKAHRSHARRSHL